MEVIDFLKTRGLQKLKDDYKIVVNPHPHLPLILLNYDAVDARENKLEYHPITRDCRSLVLNSNTFDLVSRSFRRFYNLGEYKDETFDWTNYRIEQKVDGSLISLWYYDDTWMMRTSGSWGDGQICAECPYTWQSLVFELLKGKLGRMSKYLTYVFELTSPYNQVVEPHKESSLTLLSIFDNKNGEEYTTNQIDDIANIFSIKRPSTYIFYSIERAIEWLETQEAFFEGFVLVDKDYNRIKLKSAAYLKLHRLKNNNNGFLIRNIIPLILKCPEDRDELINAFDEIKVKWLYLEGRIKEIFKNADEIHKLYPDYNQKQFALAIKGEPKYLQSILFTCRKTGILPSSCKKDFESLLISILEKEKIPCSQTSQDQPKDSQSTLDSLGV